MVDYGWDWQFAPAERAGFSIASGKMGDGAAEYPSDGGRGN